MSLTANAEEKQGEILVDMLVQTREYLVGMWIQKCECFVDMWVQNMRMCCGHVGSKHATYTTPSNVSTETS